MALLGAEAEPIFRADLISREGLLIASAEGLQPGAQFIDEWFDFEFGGRFLGSVIVESSQPFYATALHQRLLSGGRFQLTGVNPVSTMEAAPDIESVRYRVTFDATWSSISHPDSFPLGAHFSRLVGSTHNSEVILWELGAVASNAIEAMAETGLTSALRLEIGAAKAAGTAGPVLLFGGTASPGSVSLEFSVDRAFPLVTLVTMIAPNPDWFVGVSGLPLFQDGNWRDEVVVPLPGLDAGTDSGITYTHPDVDTFPPLPISELSGAPFLNDGVEQPFARLTFTRIDR